MLNCKHERREEEGEEQEGDEQREGGGGVGGERRQSHNRNYRVFLQGLCFLLTLPGAFVLLII